jgi:predicted amidohydrolase
MFVGHDGRSLGGSGFDRGHCRPSLNITISHLVIAAGLVAIVLAASLSAESDLTISAYELFVLVNFVVRPRPFTVPFNNP